MINKSKELLKVYVRDKYDVRTGVTDYFNFRAIKLNLKGKSPIECVDAWHKGGSEHILLKSIKIDEETYINFMAVQTRKKSKLKNNPNFYYLAPPTYKETRKIKEGFIVVIGKANNPNDVGEITNEIFDQYYKDVGKLKDYDKKYKDCLDEERKKRLKIQKEQLENAKKKEETEKKAVENQPKSKYVVKNPYKPFEYVECPQLTYEELVKKELKINVENVRSFRYETDKGNITFLTRKKDCVGLKDFVSKGKDAYKYNFLVDGDDVESAFIVTGKMIGIVEDNANENVSDADINITPSIYYHFCLANLLQTLDKHKKHIPVKFTFEHIYGLTKRFMNNESEKEIFKAALWEMRYKHQTNKEDVGMMLQEANSLVISKKILSNPNIHSENSIYIKAVQEFFDCGMLQAFYISCIYDKNNEMDSYKEMIQIISLMFYKYSKQPIPYRNVLCKSEKDIRKYITVGYKEYIADIVIKLSELVKPEDAVEFLIISNKEVLHEMKCFIGSENVGNRIALPLLIQLVSYAIMNNDKKFIAKIESDTTYSVFDVCKGGLCLLPAFVHCLNVVDIKNAETHDTDKEYFVSYKGLKRFSDRAMNDEEFSSTIKTAAADNRLFDLINEYPVLNIKNMMIDRNKFDVKCKLVDISKESEKSILIYLIKINNNLPILMQAEDVFNSNKDLKISIRLPYGDNSLNAKACCQYLKFIYSMWESIDTDKEVEETIYAFLGYEMIAINYFEEFETDAIIKEVSDDKKKNEIKKNKSVTTVNDEEYGYTNLIKKSYKYTYSLTDITDELLDITAEARRKYERHISSWEVRGHDRHYSSGRIVHIEPYEKGNGTKNNKKKIKINIPAKLEGEA